MSDSLPDWAPATVDLDQPSAARVYDYLLGGACNFEHDRVFAEKLLSTIPEAREVARRNRAFLRRAVRFCVDQGIRQFLDIGSGIPTVGNVHEIAQKEVPDSRVVYVDSEPVAVAHSLLILDGNEYAGAAQGNLLDVDGVLGAEPVRRLLDFDQPIAVLMAAVLHFVPDSANPGAAVARYVDAMASGSYLVLSHAAKVDLQRSQDGWKMYNSTSTPGGGRTREDVAAFMAGTELVEPGVVWLSEWRPGSLDDTTTPERSIGYAAVGRKP
ncbi:SAM-dependent methyltransferase [Actinophytocola sp.]|uniref:SAM-dependent methyltransferase n=1 Tax=Actinophytocola sp. TaxID=1872138 RepID=UPI002ED08926